MSSKYLPGILENKFCLPGGELNFGEDPDDSFIKKVKEETGITITPSAPFYVGTWIYKKGKLNKQIVATYRVAFYKKGIIKAPLPREETTMDFFRWMDLDKLPLDYFVEDEIPAIKNYLKYRKTNPFSSPT